MIMNIKHRYLYLLLFFFSFLLRSFAVDFIFNSFNSTSISLYGNAVIESNILTLTNPYPRQVGGALYPQKIPMKNGSSLLSFSTSFIFAMVPARNVLPGHGFVFLFTPTNRILETNTAQYNGLFTSMVDGNSSNHMFGVEFDVFRNEEVGDIDANHVGIDVNSLRSVITHAPGYYPDGGRDFATLKLKCWLSVDQVQVRLETEKKRDVKG